MPSSRSAKEMCQQFGENSISCKVARKREARRKRDEEEYGLTEAPKPEAAEPAPEEKPERGARRRKYLDDKISEAEGR